MGFWDYVIAFAIPMVLAIYQLEKIFKSILRELQEINTRLANMGGLLFDDSDLDD